jgi:N-acetylglucosaminyl-diphospho-decaprenol L-rhamnosyltransferase
MDLSIIIVNWNSLDYVQECIASIYDCTQGCEFEVIVVDNASSEQGVDLLKDEWPNITVIKSPENLGFAGANNLGFRHSRGETILFLNPDTRLVGPAISIMLGRMRVLPTVGIVGCKLLNTDLSVQTSCIQRFPTIFNQLMDIEYLRLWWPSFPLWQIGALFADSAEPVEVEVVSGACMMIDRTIFEKVGKFSEEYFMFAEDVDLCYQTTRLGLKNYYVGAATVIHHGGKSTIQKPVSEWSTAMKLRAIMQFCIKAHGRSYGTLYRVAMGWSACCRLAIIAPARLFLFRGEGKARVKFASAKWKAVLNWAFAANRWELEALEKR